MSQGPKILIYFSNPYLFWTRIEPALPAIKEATGARISVILSNFARIPQLEKDLRELRSSAVIDEFHLCPDYFSPIEEKYGPVGRPVSEIFFWLVFWAKNRTNQFDLVLVHTVDSLSGAFLLNYSRRMKTPIISLVPNLISREFVLTGVYASSIDVVPILERLRRESFLIQCLRAISKINKFLAFKSIEFASWLVADGHRARAVNRFASAEITHFLCDTREAKEALVGAGIPQNLVKRVTFDRDSAVSHDERKPVLVVLGGEPTTENVGTYRATLRDTLFAIARIHRTAEVCVRPHPSSPTASISREVIKSISIDNSRVLIQEPRNSPMWKAIDNASRIYGVMSSGLLEALQIGFKEVFGLVDLNAQLGYPQPDIAGIRWVDNVELHNSHGFLKKSEKSPRGIRQEGSRLSTFIASLLDVPGQQ